MVRGLMPGLTAPRRPWFRLSLPGEQTAAKLAWCEESARIIDDEMVRNGDVMYASGKDRSVQVKADEEMRIACGMPADSHERSRFPPIKWRKPNKGDLNNPLTGDVKWIPDKEPE